MGFFPISTKFELGETAAGDSSFMMGISGMQLSEETRERSNYGSERRWLTTMTTSNHMQNTQPRSTPW